MSYFRQFLDRKGLAEISFRVRKDSLNPIGLRLQLEKGREL